MLNIQETQAKTVSTVVIKKTILPKKSRTQSSEQQILAVVKETLRLFGNEEKALRWLSKSNSALDSEKPIVILETKAGRQRVIALLGQISHGMFI